MKVLLLILGLFAPSVLSQIEQDAELIPESPTHLPDEVRISEYSVNRTAFLLCRFRTLFKPEVISWFKDGYPIQDSHKYKISKKVTEIESPFKEDPLLSFFRFHIVLSVLRVTDLQIQDSGKYTCTLSKSSTPEKFKSDFNVHVTEPKVEHVTTEKGFPTMFICDGLYDKTSKAVWLKNGYPVNQDPRYQFSEKINNDNDNYFREMGIHLKEYIFVMMIMNTQVEDEADYTCRLHNTEYNTFTEKHSKLRVEKNEASVTTIREQGGAVFYCDIKDENQAHILWLKDDKPLPKDSRFVASEVKHHTPDILKDNNINLVHSAASLKILNVRLEDAGVYSCVDDNPLNNKVVQDNVLHVEEAVKPRRKQISVGELELLVCSFKTRFVPQIHWLKNGYPLAKDGRVKVTTQSKEIKHTLRPDNPLLSLLPTIETISLLQIYGVRFVDSGDYTCYVDNSKTGKMRMDIQLSVKAQDNIDQKPT